MTYENKVDAAQELIATHNDSLHEDAKSINFEAFLKKLQSSGGTSEATLASCTWEDLEDCGLPRILARSVARIFRKEEVSKIVVVDDDPEKRAKRLSPIELVAEYDVNEPDNPIGERLAKISKNMRFIVFEDDKVNIPVSQTELKRLRANYPERDVVNVSGIPVETYRVGERPKMFVDEHPLFKGVPLNPDGTSDKGINWGTIDIETRQLVRLAIEHGEISPDSYDEFDFFDIVSHDFARIASRYPKAAVRFQGLKELGDLPKLKIRLNGDKGNDGRNNPFGKNQTF